MDIILFRHGIAEDESPDGKDASRRLTREGAARTADAARGLAAIADKPDLIVTSPKVRARQTADIVAEVFGRKARELDALGQDSPAAIAEALLALDGQVVLAVGHEPALSATAELLTFGKAQSVIELKKAGCICLRTGGDGGGCLRWIATSRMLEAISDG